MGPRPFVILPRSSREHSSESSAETARLKAGRVSPPWRKPCLLPPNSKARAHGPSTLTVPRCVLRQGHSGLSRTAANARYHVRDRRGDRPGTLPVRLVPPLFRASPGRARTFTQPWNGTFSQSPFDRSSLSRPGGGVSKGAAGEASSDVDARLIGHVTESPAGRLVRPAAYRNFSDRVTLEASLSWQQISLDFKRYNHLRRETFNKTPVLRDFDISYNFPSAGRASCK